MKTYPEEESVDVVSHEVVPNAIRFMSSDARVEKAIRDEGRNAGDILE